MVDIQDVGGKDNLWRKETIIRSKFHQNDLQRLGIIIDSGSVAMLTDDHVTLNVTKWNEESPLAYKVERFLDSASLHLGMT
ncbi:hypothetical protein QUF64_15395 [Anaerolineales bacterium HSG6]|nr:hypothetical protein [Anaerolineales bacterium HSG6]